MIFKNLGGGYLEAADEQTKNFLAQLPIGQEIDFSDKKRDIRTHKAYFSLLNYIYSLLPDSYQQKISREHFYIFLKELQGKYKTINLLGKETKIYESVSFSAKGEREFKNYVREQVEFIYENLIRPIFGEETNRIIQLIEEEYHRFLDKLYKDE